MTRMDDRRRSFETKFAHDQELRFKAIARRNRLLGLWAAERLGRSGPGADAYAAEVVAADFEEAGEEDVFRKLRGDFDAAGIACPDEELRRQMKELLSVAAEAIAVT